MKTVIVILVLLLTPVWAHAQKSTVTDFSVTVNNVDTIVLTANQNLNTNFLIIQNDDGTNLIYCRWGAVAVVGTGFRLANSGGALLLDVKFPLGALHCITNAGTAKALVTRGVQPNATP